VESEVALMETIISLKSSARFITSGGFCTATFDMGLLGGVVALPVRCLFGFSPARSGNAPSRRLARVLKSPFLLDPLHRPFLPVFYSFPPLSLPSPMALPFCLLRRRLSPRSAGRLPRPPRNPAPASTPPSCGLSHALIRFFPRPVDPTVGPIVDGHVDEESALLDRAASFHAIPSQPISHPPPSPLRRPFDQHIPCLVYRQQHA
jgi:hypothetical protein